MTHLQESTLPAYVPPGRPVPWFVALVVVLAAALAVVAAFSPFRAQVDVLVPEWRVDGGRAVVTVLVTNDGAYTVRVARFRGAGLLAPAPLLARLVAPGGSQPEAGRPLGSVRLAPDETLEAVIVYVPDCAQYPRGAASGPALHLDVEVALGLTRSVVVGGDGGSSIAGTICHP